MIPSKTYPDLPHHTTGNHSVWKKLLKQSLVTLLTLTAATHVAACQPSDVTWLTNALELKEGSVVADIGAGDGEQSVAIARYVAPGGKVYSTELGAGPAQNLRRIMEREGVSNVTVIEGHPRRTNLPDRCCDALFMRRVYHHITDPSSFNRSLLQSLKPGGRLAVIDFEPRGTESDPEGRSSGRSHGVTAQTVVKELTDAGFELVSSEQHSGRNIYVIVRKPTGK